jgi:hypothetical protein
LALDGCQRQSYDCLGQKEIVNLHVICILELTIAERTTSSARGKSVWRKTDFSSWSSRLCVQ